MKKRLIALSLALVLGLCGCGKDEDNKANIDSSSAVVNEDTRKSGSDISLYMRPPSTLNPLLNDDESVDMVFRLVYEPLIMIDSEFKAQPNIAESWYFSNEGKTITLKLKNGLRWHSGQNITSNDVVYSINTIKYADESSMYKACVKYIEDVVMIDSQTVNINFSRAFSGNIYALTFPLINHKSSSGQNVYEASENMEPLGNGSFDFGSYSASKNLELIRAESCVGKNPVAERINVVISKDTDTDLYYFSTGGTDCVYGNANDLVGKNMPARVAEYSYNTNEYDFIGFNFNNAILNDKNVRKAIAYAVPKEDILKIIYLSNAKAADSPIHPDSWLYEKEVTKYNYDLNEARRLLDESGFVFDDERMLRIKTSENGVTPLSLRILVNTENGERRQCAKRLADELMSIGFDIKIDEVSFSEYQNALNNGNYDIVVGGWKLSYDNDLGVLFGNNGANISRYNDEKMNEYISEIYNAVGETSIKAAFSNAQKYISDELPYISLAFKNGKLYTGEEIEGGKTILDYSVYCGVYEWTKR